MIDARDFLFDATDHGLGLIRILAYQPGRYLQARERRAQFVRHIVQQATLTLHRGFQPSGHAVEVTTEIGQLVMAGAEVWRDPPVEITRGCRFKRPAQTAYGLRHISCEQQGREDARGKRRHNRHWGYAEPVSGGMKAHQRATRTVSAMSHRE